MMSVNKSTGVCDRLDLTVFHLLLSLSPVFSQVVVGFLHRLLGAPDDSSEHASS